MEINKATSEAVATTTTTQPMISITAIQITYLRAIGMLHRVTGFISSVYPLVTAAANSLRVYICNHSQLHPGAQSLITPEGATVCLARVMAIAPPFTLDPTWPVTIKTTELIVMATTDSMLIIITLTLVPMVLIAIRLVHLY